MTKLLILTKNCLFHPKTAHFIQNLLNYRIRVCALCIVNSSWILTIHNFTKKTLKNCFWSSKRRFKIYNLRAIMARVCYSIIAHLPNNCSFTQKLLFSPQKLQFYPNIAHFPKIYSFTQIAQLPNNHSFYPKNCSFNPKIAQLPKY